MSEPVRPKNSCIDCSFYKKNAWDVNVCTHDMANRAKRRRFSSWGVLVSNCPFFIDNEKLNEPDKHYRYDLGELVVLRFHNQYSYGKVISRRRRRRINSYVLQITKFNIHLHSENKMIFAEWRFDEFELTYMQGKRWWQFMRMLRQIRAYFSLRKVKNPTLWE